MVKSNWRSDDCLEVNMIGTHVMTEYFFLSELKIEWLNTVLHLEGLQDHLSAKTEVRLCS